METLGGRYIVAEDVGISPEEIEHIRVETSHVAGVDITRGGSGDPSPLTALGVYESIRACVEEAHGSGSLEGVSVAVQGLGHVGYHLCRLLHEAGARLVVADLNAAAVDGAVAEFGAKAVEPDEVLSAPCDVFAPCALGAVVNDETLPRFRCSIIAGSANNVLAEARHGEALAERGILYAPDYVINAAGSSTSPTSWRATTGSGPRSASCASGTRSRGSSPSPSATASPPTSPPTPWLSNASPP